MSKTAEKRERQREARREQWKKLELMIDAYAAGSDRLDVARYRPMLTDSNGVNHDGPLFDLISRAMKAERTRHGRD